LNREADMSFDDVIAFVRENPACTLATMEGEQPRARGFLSIILDDEKIYFTTGATKRVWKQISENPKVELCYFTPDFSRMLRIAGEIEEVDDPEKKQKLIDERDYLKGFSADDPVFKLLRLKNGKARFWTLADNMKEDGLEVIEL
jgi:uncharacterized pyridoxamine 5'-phosphate oxidase family protein